MQGGSGWSSSLGGGIVAPGSLFGPSHAWPSAGPAAERTWDGCCCRVDKRGEVMMPGSSRDKKHQRSYRAQLLELLLILLFNYRYESKVNSTVIAYGL